MVNKRVMVKPDRTTTGLSFLVLPAVPLPEAELLTVSVMLGCPPWTCVTCVPLAWLILVLLRLALHEAK